MSEIPKPNVYILCQFQVSDLCCCYCQHHECGYWGCHTSRVSLITDSGHSSFTAQETYIHQKSEHFKARLRNIHRQLMRTAPTLKVMAQGKSPTIRHTNPVTCIFQLKTLWTEIQSCLMVTIILWEDKLIPLCKTDSLVAFGLLTAMHKFNFRHVTN